MKENQVASEFPESIFQTGPIEMFFSQDRVRLNILVPAEIPELHDFSDLRIIENKVVLEAEDGRQRPCYALSDAIDVASEIQVAVLVVVGQRGPEMTRILKIRREHNVAGKPSRIRAGRMA